MPKEGSTDHELILYKGKRIIHSSIYKDYKIEPEYST